MTKGIATLIALCVVTTAAAQPGDDTEIVSEETLDSLDDLDLVAPSEEEAGPDTRTDGSGEITELSIGQLSNVQVEVASGLRESLMNAPGSVVVITALDIRQRGYTSIDQVFEELPGFDVAKGRGTQYATVYQRGYRTPFTQRFLFLVDGQVDNNLWTHEAELTRQYPLSNIERIEVLYGPASAVYGANAFAGIVNVVTRDGSGLADGASAQEINLQGGSWNTRSFDGTVRGRSGAWSYALSGRIFTSDEPDLSNQWGFASPSLYGDETIWGPILDLETAEEPLGSYLDRTDDYGFVGTVRRGDTRLGLIWWERSEGYGPYYAADRVQNNAFWTKRSRQAYVEHRAQVANWLTGTTLLLVRDNLVGGDWIEAQPDPAPGMEQFSYINKTVWLSLSSSALAKETFEATVSRSLSVTGGVRYERKRLQQRYDIPGYYEAYSSQGTTDDQGPHGLGSHVGHSSDATYVLPPLPTGEIGSDNIAITHDIGGFAHAIYDRGVFRLSAGARVDHNSMYGATFNPRLTGIYALGKSGAIKLLYGEAFQEPAPIQLWGGWSGRLANPELDPEKVRNTEAVFLYRTERTLSQLGVFYAHYTNVIKEEAENAGSRDITGVEYNGRFTLPNPIDGADAINGFANATVTMGWGSQRYDHAVDAWIDDDNTRLGDIAPLKANAGASWPLPGGFGLHVRGNFVSERRLYSRNPLRDPSRPGGERTIDPYFVLNANAWYALGNARLALRVDNIFDSSYFHPGVEAASSGDDFDNRSLGFQSSLLPQSGRAFFVTFALEN